MLLTGAVLILCKLDDRDFYNMNEDTIKPYLNGLFEV